MRASASRIDRDRPSSASLKGTLLPEERPWVEERMRAMGFTVTALAARLGVSRKHLSQLLHGHAPFTPAMVERLARCFDVESWLVTSRLHDGVIITDRLEDIPRNRDIVFHEPAEAPSGEWFSDDDDDPW